MVDGVIEAPTRRKFDDTFAVMRRVHVRVRDFPGLSEVVFQIL